MTMWEELITRLLRRDIGTAPPAAVPHRPDADAGPAVDAPDEHPERTAPELSAL